jgi:mRNA interferase YafQ
VTKYTVKPSVRFQKDLKRIAKRGYDIALLTDVIKLLSMGEALPKSCHDHNLTGNFSGCKECHIKPDWLLIYELSESDLLLYLTRTGTHADLLEK